MKRTTLTHTSQQARILIVTPTAGSCAAIIPLTVAALIVWFLGCIPAQALGVMIFGQVVAFRCWLREWRAYMAGRREDLGFMWAVLTTRPNLSGWREDVRLWGLALSMTARLEFA